MISRVAVDRPLIGCAELAHVAGVGLGREYFSHRWNVGSSGGVRLFFSSLRNSMRS